MYGPKDDDAPEIEPAPLEAELPPDDDFYAPEPPPERPTGSKRGATAVAFVVLALAVLSTAGIVYSVKLHFEHQATLATLDQCVQGVATLSVKLNAPETVQRRMGWLQKSVGNRDWAQASQAIEALGRPDTVTAPPGSGFGDPIAGGADGKLPDPMQVEDLPMEARSFFARTPDAWRAFLGFTQAGLQLREAGIDVDDLRDLRTQMLEAARLGQEEKLSNLLAEARGVIEHKTGPEGGQGFERDMQNFGKAFAMAQQQQRDVRPAARLAGQAERAARQGDMARARELIVKAATALKSEPRMRMPRRPGGMMMRGPMPQQMGPPEMAFLRFLTGQLNSVMQMERGDLARMWDKINIAADAIREHNGDQLREILSQASEALDAINVRRQQMSANIQETQRIIMSDARPPEGQRPSGPSREEMMQRLPKQIDEVLAEARDMDDEEFARERERLTVALIEVLMPRPSQPKPPDVNEADLSPEERVRAKLQIVAQPYAELKRRDVDTSELDAIFSEAREVLAAGDYERAEELVDSSVPILDELLRENPPVEQEDATDVATDQSTEDQAQ